MARSAYESLSFRTRLAGFFTVLAVAAILARLFDLQLLSPVVEPEVSERKATREMPWKPRRGLILDRNHRQLVRNDDRIALRVELHRVEDRVAVAKALAPLLAKESSLDYESLLKAIPADSGDLKPNEYRERTILRSVSPELAETLKTFDPPGIARQEVRYVQETANEVWRCRLPVRGLILAGEPNRTYLKKELAAQVIGFVNAENKGSMGVELLENERLLARPIKIQARRYGDQRTILQNDYTRGVPQRGADVVLTLDETIQWLAERTLFDQCDKLDARVGVALVMNPYNGDVLAMANYPPFEADRKGAYGSEAENNRRGSNHAVTALFEPGSTLKPFIVAAGLDLGVITEESRFDLENGVRWIKGRSKPITDVHPIKGEATVSEILVQSSNVGVGKIAEKIVDYANGMPDKKVLYDYLRAFGFGGTTGISLPGETPMYYRPSNPAKWSHPDIMTLAFGTGPVMVSPIGLAAAYCLLANGGIRVHPRIVDGYTGNLDGRYYPNPVPAGERVISEEVAKSIVGMLRKVVESERSLARSEWYDVGGKTGTALKWVDGQYSRQHRMLSFAGIAPIDDPKIVVVVMIDEPKGIQYGNMASAPVFRRIVEDVLAYMHVMPERIPSKIPTPTPVPTHPPAGPVVDPRADHDDTPVLAGAEPALGRSNESSEAEGGVLALLERVALSLRGEEAEGADRDRVADGRGDR